MTTDKRTKVGRGLERVSFSSRAAKAWEAQAQEAVGSTISVGGSWTPPGLFPASEPPPKCQQKRGNEPGAVARRHQRERDPVRLGKQREATRELSPATPARKDVWALRAGRPWNGPGGPPYNKEACWIPSHQRFPRVFLPEAKG